MLNKVEIRHLAKIKFQEYDTKDRELAPILLMKNLLPFLNKANSVIIYHADSLEISLLAVIEYCWLQHKAIYEPIAYKNSRIMQFAKLSENDLIQIKGGVKKAIFAEHDIRLNNEIQWYNVDLILLPLLAVSQTGYRVGRGGGYYDATLAKVRDLPEVANKPLLCGVGFDFQRIGDFTPDIWDVRLDYFISEKRIIKF